MKELFYYLFVYNHHLRLFHRNRIKELFFKAHFIDQNYNKISNKNIKIIFKSNDNTIETKTLRTSNDGNIIYHFPVILENMSLKIIIDDIEMMVNI